MIRAIKMSTCTPYQQSELSDCKKVNFIFGSNGSGKSTISRYLSNVDHPSSRYSNCSLEWTSPIHETIYVYNREFRQNNFQQTIPGIFTMGSATIEDINALEKKKNELSNEQEKLNKKIDSYNKARQKLLERENKFKDDAWNELLKKNENDFQKAFEGLRGSKDRFVAEVKQRIEGKPSHTGKICEINDLKDRAKTLYEAKSEKCSHFNLSIDSYTSILEEIRTDDIWNTVIVGNDEVDISALIRELGSSSWVEQGRKYIRIDSKKCPFCQQETITEDFRRKLENFFDNRYQAQIDRVRQLATKYHDAADHIITTLEDTLTGNEVGIKISELDVNMYQAKQKILSSMFSENEKSLESKITDPGRKVVISNLTQAIKEIKEIIGKANSNIDVHNKLIDERDTEKEKLTDDIWATILDKSALMIQDYQKDISGIGKGIRNINNERSTLQTQVNKLAAEITEKGKTITSVQPTIDEINRSLKAYGFTNFSIQPAKEKKNHYYIRRDDGSSAINTLSEGEETFLSFLYFMQMTKGSPDRSHVSDHKIIVLDDPISSLDSNILYIVGTMVKNLSREIRNGKGDVVQLFVLTHNVFFHKEASFIDGRTQACKDVNYWIIRKNDGVSTIQSYGMNNPISTSYELLWKELRDNTDASLISVQNIMRRIIENYFGMLGGSKKDDELISNFDSIEDQIIVRSLFSWINDGSHSIPDDLYIDSYSDAIPKYKKVFKEIFYKSGQIAHYNMMMGIEDNE